MPWDIENTVLLIPPESIPGGGTFSDWVKLKPGETAHIHVERTDSHPSNDDWLVELFGSPDAGTKVSTVPLLSYRFSVADLTKDLIVTGLFSWRIRLSNATDITDLVAGTVNFRRNNVNQV